MRPGKELHDQLRAELPEVACVDECPYCTEKEEASSKEEEQVSDKVYDQATLDALLADARTKAADDARAEADAKVTELQATLAERDTALAAVQAEVENLKTEIAEREEAERIEALADERAAKVAGVTSFSDEQIAERKLTWAGMTEEAFEATLADLKAVTESAKAHSNGKLPKTKVEGTRETAGESGTDFAGLRKLLGAASDS